MHPPLAKAQAHGVAGGPLFHVHGGGLVWVGWLVWCGWVQCTLGRGRGGPVDLSGKAQCAQRRAVGIRAKRFATGGEQLAAAAGSSTPPSSLRMHAASILMCCAHFPVQTRLDTAGRAAARVFVCGNYPSAVPHWSRAPCFDSVRDFEWPQIKWMPVQKWHSQGSDARRRAFPRPSSCLSSHPFSFPIHQCA